MRNISTGLAGHLASGATTLCRCWRVTRRDGVVQGFTDHDENLAFASTTFRAGAGFEGSEIEARLGFAVTGTELHGALSSETLSEDDLAAGRYDDAKIELYLVDWTEVENRLLLRTGNLGEVRREDSAFSAEVRGIASRLDEEKGRIFAASCDADLGDARCKIDLTDSAYRGEGTIVALEGTSIFAAIGLDTFIDGWFTQGRLQWTSGANAGLAIEVKEHRSNNDGVRLSLWQKMPAPLAAGDAFIITAGCDKRFATCSEKFSNALNFRGFPHLPGNDFVVAYAVPGEPGNDGSVIR
ncbi:MAG TPA: DUF2163 domain-containing protein [Xanthobacteraceae bacterium]|nr:DUF2163 domain-containing protein [Xanthobacteraceae bacterium]